MRPARIIFVVFLAFLLLYLASLAPGAYWGDSAQLQMATASPTVRLGVRSYPLWTGLSWLLASASGLPADVAANVLSAICGAAAVGLCFLFLRALTRSVTRSLVGALSLGISHLLWSTSSAAEVYSLTMVFLLLILLFLHGTEQRWKGSWFLLGLVLGLSLLHHRMIQAAAVVVLVPPSLRWIRRERATRTFLPLLAGLAAGALPFLVILLFVPGAIAAHHALRDFLLGAFRPGVGTPLAFLRELGHQSGYEVRFLLYNLPGPQLVFAIAALPLAFRQGCPMGKSLLGLLLVGLVLPVLFPQLGDRYVLMLPSVLALCILAGLAPAPLLGLERRGLRAILTTAVVVSPCLVYFAVAHSDLPLRLGLFSGREYGQSRQFLWPPKRDERDPEELVRRALESLPPAATLLTDWGEGNVVIYLQKVEGVRPDVKTYMCFTPKQRRLAASRTQGPLFLTGYPLLSVRPETPDGFEAHEVVPNLLWRLEPSAQDSPR